MTDSTLLIILLFAVCALLLLIAIMLWLSLSTRAGLRTLPLTLETSVSAKQDGLLNKMVVQVGDGFAKQTERISNSQSDSGERLRSAVNEELQRQRASIVALALEQTNNLAANREELGRQLMGLSSQLSAKQDALKTEMLGGTLERIAEQSRLQQELIQTTLRDATLRINGSIENLTVSVDKRLAEIAGKVSERLDEGFKKTNDTFVNVMARLATIDEAQKKIDGLTTNVVSLQQLLGDKRSRGALGEMQLEQLVRNMLAENCFEFQYSFATHGVDVRADCVLKLPEPVGMIAIDSKFPLENYERMVAAEVAGVPDKTITSTFKSDVRRHIDAIASKYIIANVTSDGAVMFVPAEAVFAEIHAYHRDIVEYAQNKRIWIASPTTLMAILNTTRAVLKDVETRKQIHVIKDELGKLGKEFGRFDERMRKLADHIRQANDDVKDVSVTSDKISKRFASIERVEIDAVSSKAIASKGGSNEGGTLPGLE
jgi:DNA recombination protein RmuC